MSRAAKVALLRLAETQYGHVTTAQARALGVSQRVVHGMTRSGELVSVHRGVHRVAGVAPSWRGDVCAALQAAGGDAAASHSTALRLLGMDRLGAASTIELTMPGLSPTDVPGVTVHRTRRLHACDVCVVSGLRVTTAARTLVDLAARVDRATLTALTDDAICAGVTARSWLYGRAVTLLPGRTGVGLLVSVTAPGAEGTFRSWLERRAAAVLRLHGLPQPRWNAPVHGEHGLIGIVDSLYEPERVILEWEGPRFHDAPAQRRRDAGRFNDLQLAGYRPFRFTWHDVVERPGHVAERVRLVLRQSQSVSGPPPRRAGGGGCRPARRLLRSPRPSTPLSLVRRGQKGASDDGGVAAFPRRCVRGLQTGAVGAGHCPGAAAHGP